MYSVVNGRARGQCARGRKDRACVESLWQRKLVVSNGLNAVHTALQGLGGEQRPNLHHPTLLEGCERYSVQLPSAVPWEPACSVTQRQKSPSWEGASKISRIISAAVGKLPTSKG